MNNITTADLIGLTRIKIISGRASLLSTIIAGVLLIAGFVRSFFFTSVNALSFADISNEDASKATSMSAVLQQISLALKELTSDERKIILDGCLINFYNS